MRRSLMTFLAAAVAVACVVAFAPLAGAQNPNEGYNVTTAAKGATQAAQADAKPDPTWKPEGPVPRLADGHPDLSGVWWAGGEVAVVGLNVGTPRARDGAPAPGSFAALYQPWAIAKAKTMGHKDDPSLRCIPNAGPGGTQQIVQNLDFAAILVETQHGFRIVPTHGGPHSDEAAPSFRGDSVGHWEGDTLVVDVTNFTDRNWIASEGQVSFHSDALHVVERYTRLAANALEYERTYEDPKVLTGPYKTPKTIRRLAPFKQVMEVYCTGTETAGLMETAAKDNYGVK